MTKSIQHQQRLQHAIYNANEAIHKLDQAQRAADKALETGNPKWKQHAAGKLQQSIHVAEEIKEQLLAEANESQEQQVLQNLQELEGAIANAKSRPL